MPNQRHIELPLQTRVAPISAVDATKRTATLVWSTGARVKRYDWERGQFYMEELSLNPDNVRLGRMNAGAPLLNTHSRYSLADVLGAVEPGSATVNGTEGRATVRFSKREDVQPVFSDVQDGIIRSVSAGYAVHRMEMLPADAESAGLPIYRAVDWEPMEVSLVPIGADAGAGVRAEKPEQTYPCIIQLREVEMDQDEAPENESAKPSAAETRRAQTIRELCTRNKIPEIRQLELITSSMSLAEVREEVLTFAAAKTAEANIRGAVGDVYLVDQMEPSQQRNLVAEALAARFGGPAASEPAKRYMGMSVLDVARMCLEQRGIRTTGMNAAQIITRTAHSTSDFPELLTGAGNRILGAAYMAHRSGITKVFRQTTIKDFRARQVLKLSEAPALDTVLPGGEYKRGTMAETKESYALATFGKMFGINRQALQNDDLNAFGDMNMRFGQSAAEKEAATLTALVHSNPTLAQDNAALFSATHVNLTTGSTGAAISVDSLGVGVGKIRLQKGISENIVLGLGPRYLLVPSALEQLAKQYTSQNYTAATASNVNPWNQILEPVVEPRLDALSTTAWYLLTDPAVFANFEYAYLEGEPGPQLFTRPGWDVDGIEFKCRFDLGAGAIEYRGGYKNAGA